MTALDVAIRFYAQAPIRRAAITVGAAAVLTGACVGAVTSQGNPGATVAPTRRLPSSSTAISSPSTAPGSSRPQAAASSVAPSLGEASGDGKVAASSPPPLDEPAARGLARRFVAAWSTTTGGHAAWYGRLCGPVRLAAPGLCTGFARTDLAAISGLTLAPESSTTVLAADGYTVAVRVTLVGGAAVDVTATRATVAAPWLITSIAPSDGTAQ